MNQRQFNRESLPKEFKFRVNKKHLYDDDPDYIYTCKQTVNTAWCVYWEENGKSRSRLYSINDILDYIIDLSWLIE